jgi:1-acyl-sn-glycerol-3-phosphate acyltransferase
MDSVFLPLVVWRKVTFVAKAEYFESWQTAWFFRAVGMIPLKREGGTASARALAAAGDVLKGKGVLGIYPEGTRSPDGRLYRGHTGVARLSLQCGVPVIPVAELGTAQVQPIGSLWPRPFRRVEVRMGEPLHWQGEAADADAPRQFTEQIMTAIAALSGQERAWEYAKRDRARLSAPGSEADPIRGDEPGRLWQEPA